MASPRAVSGFGEWVRVDRILAVILGLLIAAAALYLWVAGSPFSEFAVGPPHESIDDDSREKLDRVLRDADG